MRSEATPLDLAFSARELELDPGEVARLAHCGPGDAWRRSIDAALEEGRALLLPRARCAPAGHGPGAALFAGGTPVEAIAARGVCWAFAATAGEAIERRVRDHFAQGKFLEAVLLDAVGSVAVEATCDLLQRECAGAGPSARFSPGYCMWRLENQRGLFALLRPEEIGIRLLPSMLMQPMKSVSGLVVKTGSEDELIVPAEECAQCEAAGCSRRGAIG